MKRIAFVFCLFLAGLAIQPGQATEIDSGGTLNPEEMSLNKSFQRALEGDVDMVVCAQGYLMYKKGSHKEARAIFEECARQGWTSAMIWLSFMDDNGLSGDYDPVSAAAWDLKAAELGDPMGMFNYGLDLIRGRGTSQDIAKGRRFVDDAAALGLDAALSFQDDDYDIEAVTPDSDIRKAKPN